jgi:hypothetical protein
MLLEELCFVLKMSDLQSHKENNKTKEKNNRKNKNKLQLQKRKRKSENNIGQFYYQKLQWT